MRDWYDNPQLTDISEEREARLPYGPLAILDPPEIELVGGLPPEAADLLRSYLGGTVGTLEFATRMEAFKRKPVQPVLGP